MRGSGRRLDGAQHVESDDIQAPILGGWMAIRKEGHPDRVFGVRQSIDFMSEGCVADRIVLVDDPENFSVEAHLGPARVIELATDPADRRTTESQFGEGSDMGGGLEIVGQIRSPAR